MRYVRVPVGMDAGKVGPPTIGVKGLAADVFGVPNRELDAQATLCLDDIRLE